MSKYTTEVRFICESIIGLKESVGAAQVNNVIKQAAPLIFEDYPIFDEAYRQALNQKIIRHYYTREIGFETFGLWKLYLNTRMQEIMPYYNQLYKSQLLEFNPFYDVDLTRKHIREGKDTHDTVANSSLSEDINGKNHSKTVGNTVDQTSTKDDGTTTTSSSTTEEQTSSTNHEDKYSDTPQGNLNGVISAAYLTNARVINDVGTGSSTSSTKGNTTTDNLSETASIVDTTATTDGTSDQNRALTNEETSKLNIDKLENYIEQVTGKQGTASYASMLQEFRQTFLNIDMQIIEELSDLFMNIY